MQTIAQNGYTQQEIYNALQFKSGAREIKFHYDHLDQYNNKLGDLTNVLSCSIAQAYLDDVKRTAKFSILDDGTINFASDRIRPWARLMMPADARTYSGFSQTLNYIKTAEYLFNADTTTAVHNTGLSGSAFNGTVNGSGGSSVLFGSTAISEGSAVRFQGNTAPAGSGYVTVHNGAQFFDNTSTGATGVSNAWSWSTFLIWTGTATGFGTVDPIFRSADGTLQFSINQTDIYWNVTNAAGGFSGLIHNPYGYNLRHIAFSWSINNQPTVYLNGQAATDTYITIATAYGQPVNTTGDLWIGYGFNGTLDGLTFYNGIISASDVLNLYRSGIGVGPWGSSNYAEWPQGVFLLSSPARASDDNAVITRAIDAYDQEQAYIDDVVTSRYTAQIGTLYINNILGLLMNQPAVNTQLSNLNFWNESAGVAIQNAGASASATMPGATTTSNGGSVTSTSRSYSLANIDFITNMTIPMTGNRLVDMNISSLDQTIVYEFFVAFGTLNARSTINGTVTTYISQPYATSPKWFRMQESRGYFTYQVSSDGINWTVMATIPSPSYLIPFGMGVYDTLTSGTDTAWSVAINNMTLIAYTALTGTNLSPSTAFLKASKDYDPGTTKLAIMNDLLNTIGYESLSYTDMGDPVIKPYVNPNSRPAEYVYADDHTSVMMPAASDSFDIYGVPNQFVYVASNPDQTLYTATYTNSNPLSPSSTVSRGRTIVHYELENDAPDLLTLQTRALNAMVAASQVYDEFTFTTAIMPFHSNNDVMGIAFSVLKLFDKYSEVNWSFDCKDGATMKHVVRRQVQV